MSKTEKIFLPEAEFSSPEHTVVENVEMVSMAGAKDESGSSSENIQHEVEALTREITMQMDVSKSGESAPAISYEMNGVRVDVPLLRNEVLQLSAQEQGLLRDTTVDAITLNALASDRDAAPLARKQAQVATLGTAFFGVGAESSHETESVATPSEGSAQGQVEAVNSQHTLGFTDWVARRGRKGIAILAAVIGMGAMSPAFAGGREDRYQEAAARTAVGVLAGVLGTRVETPYRIKRGVGPIQDRAVYGLERVNIEHQGREQEITLRERVQIRAAQERYGRAQDAFDVKFEMYQLAHQRASVEEFIATKEGARLYERMRSAELTLSRQTEHISQSADDARERLDGRYREAQQRIENETSREVQGVYRGAEGRNDEVIGQGAGDITRAVVRGIFGR